MLTPDLNSEQYPIGFFFFLCNVTHDIYSSKFTGQHRLNHTF